MGSSSMGSSNSVPSGMGGAGSGNNGSYATYF